MPGLRRCAVNTFLALLAALTATLVFAATALAAASITVTFVRHAESQANADGIINTGVPGPDITDPIGKDQAEAIAAALAGNGHDGIYASDMVRTQQTAAPLAGLLGKNPIILPGLHEIDAGIYEGSSEDDGLGRLGYALSPALWMLGLRFIPMPGSSDADGNVFQNRVSDAIQVIYESGQQNPVAFSHGATIMFWTMMNVDNPDLGLLFTHQLGNTGVVVINGNPDDGWTLVSWDGVAVDPDPSFGTKLFVNVRDLIVAPQEAAYAVGQALATGNLFEAATAFVDAVFQVAWAPVKFVASVAGDLIHELFKPAAAQGVTTSDADAAPEPAARLTTGPDAIESEPSGDGAVLTLVKSATAEDVAAEDVAVEDVAVEDVAAADVAAADLADLAPAAQPQDEAGDPAADTPGIDVTDDDHAVVEDDAVKDDAAVEDAEAGDTGAGTATPTAADPAGTPPATDAPSDTPADHAQDAAA